MTGLLSSTALGRAEAESQLIVPRYLIIKDGKIVSDQYGVDHWAYTVGDLKKLLG